MARTTFQRSTGVERASKSGASTHHSLALKHVLRRFRSVGGSRILDLGPALGRNVNFFGHFASKIYIADLYETLRRHARRAKPDRGRLARVLERDLPQPRDAPIDLVLVWDLLNYLDRQQVADLGRRLARLCRGESLVFSLISTAKSIPDRPTRFLILDAETLRYDNDSALDRPAPGYKEPDLDRLLPAFEVETSFLLRNGIQEYVLRLRSAGSADASRGESET